MRLEAKIWLIILGISSLLGALFVGVNFSQAEQNEFKGTLYKELPSFDIRRDGMGVTESGKQFQSEIIKTDFGFNAVGFVWKQPKENTYRLKIRTGTSRSALSSWRTLSLMDDVKDGSDRTSTDLYFPDQKSNYFQYQLELLRGDQLILEQFKPVYLDSTDSQFQTQTSTQSNSSPYIISRADWGCNESLMTWTPEYAPVRKIIVHHTAGPNNPSDPKATIRGIYQYHAVTLGWGDIGYNYLVDQYGNVYQGRKGDNGVIGGHASGYNTGSVGIAVLGTYTSVAPSSAARNAVAKVSAWKAAYNGFKPNEKSSWKDEYTYNVAGHRDYNSTACPGNAFYSCLSSIRSTAYNSYFKNYEPGAVTDLRVVARQPDQVELEWTASGGFWEYGLPEVTQIFYSTTPIKDQYSFLGVVAVAPEIPGSLQRETVTGLSPGVRYYFAVRSKNWNNKWSTVSKNACDFTKPIVDFLASATLDSPYDTAPGGNLYLWRTYNFSTVLGGTLRVELTGHADANGSSDDDDLKLILDGNDYGWGGEYGLDGNVQDSRVKTILIEVNSSVGDHTLEIWADETPTLHNFYIEGPNCEGRSFAIYPQEETPDLNIALFKEYQFEVAEAGDYKIEVTATADSNGSADDDDLRFMIDDTDYGWTGTNGFDGKTEKGREKTVTVNQNLTAGMHTIKIYADETPVLNAIEVYPAIDLQKVSSLAANQSGNSRDLNCALWRIKQFTSEGGAAKIKVQVAADSNGSADDDDLKIVLDNVDYHWNSNKSFDGSLNQSQSCTIVINQLLSPGIHTIKVYVDETPNLQNIEIFATPSVQNYLVESYPEEVATGLRTELWKDTDYSFTLTSNATVKMEVVGAADSNGSNNDDDLKLVLVKTNNPPATYDYGWNNDFALNGAVLNSASKLVTITRTLLAGNYKLQIWGDATPTLNSVIISKVN